MDTLTIAFDDRNLVSVIKQLLRHVSQSKENDHNEPEIDGTQDGEGRNGGNEMTQQMKSALLAALEKDEKFAFLREKYGDIGKWFEKV